MTVRARWLWWLTVAAAGCHSFVPSATDGGGDLRATEQQAAVPQPDRAPPPAPASPNPPLILTAAVLQKGEPAAPPVAEPEYAPSELAGAAHLTLAAERIEKGDEAGACAHLRLYLNFHPEHTAVRPQLAELLWRQHHSAAAREQYERFEAEAQEQPAIALSQRIRCESRLARIAEEQDDEFAEHLHRGIGLYLLAQEHRTIGDESGGLSTEGLMFKAATELTRAHRIQPAAARPSWYLYRVWSELGQDRAASERLRAAFLASPFSPLTPVERRNLTLANARLETSRTR